MISELLLVGTCSITLGYPAKSCFAWVGLTWYSWSQPNDQLINQTCLWRKLTIVIPGRRWPRGRNIRHDGATHCTTQQQHDEIHCTSHYTTLWVPPCEFPWDALPLPSDRENEDDRDRNREHAGDPLCSRLEDPRMEQSVVIVLKIITVVEEIRISQNEQSWH